MAGVAGFKDGNMCGRCAGGKYIVMTLIALTRQLFKQAANVASLAIE
jgi:hypothetical protein